MTKARRPMKATRATSQRSIGRSELTTRKGRPLRSARVAGKPSGRSAANRRLDRLEARDKAPTQREEDDLLSAINALRDDDEDPITDLGQMKRAMKAFIRQQNQDSEAERVAATERARVQTLARDMSAAEADFAADHPDYPQAVEHFKKARAEEFEDMGCRSRTGG